jgi:citrate synthase
VDFYSGIIYQALGIPVNMFTTMFAMGRMPGWLAQWKEMRSSGAARIARPHFKRRNRNLHPKVSQIIPHIFLLKPNS